MGELSAFARQYTESLSTTLGSTVCVTDHDQIIAASGGGKKELQDKYISRQLEQALQGRGQIAAQSGEKKYVKLTEEQMEEYSSQIIHPILCEGDVIGSVIILEKEKQKKLGETEQKMAACAANFLGRQMEQ